MFICMDGCRIPFDIDPGPEIVLTNFINASDSYIYQLDSAGNYNWNFCFGGMGFESTGRFCLTEEAVFLTGLHDQNIPIDTGQATVEINVHPDPGYYNNYIIRFDIEKAPIVVDSTNSPADPEVISPFGIYPNPTLDILTVNLEDAEYLSLVIYDDLGQVVFRTYIEGPYTTLDLSTYASANYILEVTSNLGTEKHKIIKLN